MNTVFPDVPGLSGALMIGHRRRPGSGVSADNIEQVFSVIVKRAYDITPNADPALGSLAPREDGPEIFEGDFPENLLRNADFADGGASWTVPGAMAAEFGEGDVTLSADGQQILSQSVNFGRQLRERRFGIGATAVAEAAQPLPQLRVAGGSTITQTDPGAFGADPATLGSGGIAGAGEAGMTLRAEFPSIAANDVPVTYSQLVVVSTEYESDMVPFKPEADIIVIADAPPVPLSVSVNGTTRFDQSALSPELTGLGWEGKMDTPREAEAGDVLNMTQPLADDFQNRWFNGYRRNRRQGGSVPYPSGGDEIVVTREGTTDYGFTLPVEVPALRHKWFLGTGDDDPCLWRGRDVEMVLDTLVIEPDRDHAYAVWRAVWAVDDPLGGFGPIPVDANREAAVAIQGGA